MLTLNEALRTAYGLHDPLRELPGEVDRNFRCGDRLVKVGVHDTPVARLDAMDDAMRRVGERVPVGIFPRPVPAADGSERVELAEGLLRVLTWVPGRPLAEVDDPTPETLAEVGRLVAQVDRALAGLDHPGMEIPVPWNMMSAGDLATDASDPTSRAVLERFAQHVRPHLEQFSAQALHNDANEHNVIVDGRNHVVGLVDFGDLCLAPRICGLAVAGTYAMARARHPWPALLAVVEGYHAEVPLTAAEIDVLPDLIRVRLAMSATIAVLRRRDQPDNEYLLVSQDVVRALAERLGPVPHALDVPRLRAACGFDAVPSSREIRRYLLAHPAGPVCTADLSSAPVLDWSVDHVDTDVDVPTPSIGRYLENRQVYAGDAFVTDESEERRTLHLGIDVFLPAGTPILAPLEGVVADVAWRPEACDWGGVVVVKHETDRSTPFWTLYGHLDRASTDDLTPGVVLSRGDGIGQVGERDENGGWSPHLHLQLFTSRLDARETAAPGVAAESERDVWASVSPDPNLVLGLGTGARVDPAWDRGRLLRARRVSTSAAQSIAYHQPLRIVRGRGQYLYDDEGRRYLDFVNNVCHVGHAHPRVVRAAAEQMGRLNTNTRYLHDLLVTYTRRLTATLPDPLNVVFLVNSGSEANDLALRLARHHTGASDVIVLDHAYHGNLQSLIEISPYKFDGPGGAGRPPYVRVCPVPRSAADADAVGEATRSCRAATFIAESALGVAGQVMLPVGYLSKAYAAARTAGALCIADEVQVGFGRLGEAFWGFELGGVVPDIVTLGKPIANGHPVGAVVTTPEIARSFANGMEYFNTFGGNPVSCATAIEVLGVVEDERLQSHASTLGAAIKQALAGLATEHPGIADVRGSGLFLGIELRTADGLPDASTATGVIEYARHHGVLLSTDGPDHNVVKMKPPMVVTDGDADQLVSVLDDALGNTA